MSSFRVGDVVLFERPTQWWGPGDPILGDSEILRLGLIIHVETSVHVPFITLYHEGERFVIPESWCRHPAERPA